MRGRPRKKPEPDEESEAKTPVELVKQVLIKRIKRNPPNEQLVVLCREFSRILMAEARIEKGGSFMSGFDPDDDPDEPPEPTLEHST